MNQKPCSLTLSGFCLNTCRYSSPIGVLRWWVTRTAIADVKRARVMGDLPLESSPLSRRIPASGWFSVCNSFSPPLPLPPSFGDRNIRDRSVREKAESGVGNKLIAKCFHVKSCPVSQLGSLCGVETEKHFKGVREKKNGTEVYTSLSSGKETPCRARRKEELPAAVVGRKKNGKVVSGAGYRRVSFSGEAAGSIL